MMGILLILKMLLLTPLLLEHSLGVLEKCPLLLCPLFLTSNHHMMARLRPPAPIFSCNPHLLVIHARSDCSHLVPVCNFSYLLWAKHSQIGICNPGLCPALGSLKCSSWISFRHYSLDPSKTEFIINRHWAGPLDIKPITRFQVKNQR